MSANLEPLRAEAIHAVRNFSKLGISLLATWAVAVAARIVLPRSLGPEIFGEFQFADSFTTAFFILTGLGIDTYVRKELAIGTEQATDFFGGLLLARFVIAIVSVSVMTTLLIVTARPPDVYRLVLIFSVYQFFLILNGTYGALLHAAADVDKLAVINVAGKLLWGVGVVVTLMAGAGAQGVAIALGVSEILKSIALTKLVQKNINLRFRVDLRSVGAVMIASLPFYLSSVASSLYDPFQVTLIAFRASNAEVGWYGAASNISAVGLLLTPVLGWVLLPMTGRAAARSDEELTIVARRALEVILTFAIPAALLVCLGADVLSLLVFGPYFGPSALTLRVMAPTFVVTYIAIVSTTILIRLERGWTATVIALTALVLNGVLTWNLVPLGMRMLGKGGAGVGAAVAALISESYLTTLTTAFIVSRLFDRRNLMMIGKTLGACGIVLCAHRWIPAVGLVRLTLDGALYAALVITSNAVRLRELTAFMRVALRPSSETDRLA